MAFLTTSNKKSLLLATTYTFLMGIGMYLMYSIFNFQYATLGMINFFAFFLPLIILFTIVFCKKNFIWSEIGFQKTEKKHLLWLLPTLLAIITILIFSFQDASSLSGSQWFAIAVGLFMAMLIGVGEEVVYRGAVLHSFIKNRPVWIGMIISAVLFSLVHAVNVFGGMSTPDMLGQLQGTLITGLLYAPIAILLRNIWPLIIIHGLWDFSIVKTK